MATNPRKATKTDKLFGERLKARRIMQRMSQNDLGNALGVSFQQIQKYEKGTNRVSFAKMILIASILGCDPDYFIEGLTSPKKTNGHRDGAISIQTLDAFATSKGGIRLINAWLSLKSDKQRTQLCALAETLV